MSTSPEKMEPKPRGRGRPKSARVRIDAAVLPEVEAALRAKARALAKAAGHKRPQLGAAIEHFVDHFPQF